MRAKREFRDRDDVEVLVLDALVDRSEDGMTVFELRSQVAVDIDVLEGALAELNDDGLVSVEENGERTVIKPDEQVVPAVTASQEEDESLYDRIRRRLPF